MDMHPNPNLQGVLNALIRWRRQVIVFILITTIAAGIAGWLSPKKYLSTVVVFPSNSYLTDKSHLFNSNIQQLYSPLGNSDDLDHLYAIASSGTLFSFIIDSLKLVHHFDLDKNADSIAGASKILKKNTNIIKSENGELRIEVWDKDKNISAAIASAMLIEIQSISNGFALQSTSSALKALNDSEHSIKDSAMENKTAKSFAQQARELELNLEAAPPAFVILEKPHPAIKPGKPDMLLIIISSFLLSIVFAVVAVLVAERSKSSNGSI